MTRPVRRPVRGESAASDPGGSTVRRRSALLALTAAAALSLGSCGALGLGTAAPTSTPSDTSAPTAPTSASSAPTSTASSASPKATKTTKKAASPPSYSTMAGGSGAAKALVLADDAVPSGWSVSQPRDTGGYRMTVCGVDLEPNAPVDGAQKRWQASARGPFLEEHVRVYDDATARTVIPALGKALAGCKGYTTTDSSGNSATYSVQRLAVADAPPGTATWRQRLTMPAPQTTTASPTAQASVPTTSASPSASAHAPVLIQDVAMTRKGSSVVLLASYSVDTAPQPQVLATALRALRAKAG